MNVSFSGKKIGDCSPYSLFIAGIFMLLYIILASCHYIYPAGFHGQNIGFQHCFYLANIAWQR